MPWAESALWSADINLVMSTYIARMLDNNENKENNFLRMQYYNNKLDTVTNDSIKNIISGQFYLLING